MKEAHDLIKKYMDVFVKDENILETEKLFKYFDEALGDEACRHCDLREVQDDILIVEVDHPAWIQQMGFLKRGILQFYSVRVPRIKLSDIHFVLAKKFAKNKIQPKTDPKPEVVTESNRSLDQILSSLGRLVEERNIEGID